MCSVAYHSAGSQLDLLAYWWGQTWVGLMDQSAGFACALCMLLSHQAHPQRLISAVPRLGECFPAPCPATNSAPLSPCPPSAPPPCSPSYPPLHPLISLAHPRSTPTLTTGSPSTCHGISAGEYTEFPQIPVVPALTYRHRCTTRNDISGVIL